MTGFEPRMPGDGSNCSTICATTAQVCEANSDTFRHQIKLNWPVLLYWFILLKFIGLNISNWHSRWLKIAFYFSFVWLFSSRWFGTRRSKTKKFWFFVYNFAMLLLLIQFDLVYISCKNNLEDYTSGWQYSTILWQFIFYVDCLFKAIPQTTNHPWFFCKIFLSTIKHTTIHCTKDWNQHEKHKLFSDVSRNIVILLVYSIFVWFVTGGF